MSILTSTPGIPDSFQATVGQVTLRLTSTNGNVSFYSATYNGNALEISPSSTITFDITAGHTVLSVVYSFTDPQSTAKLSEDSFNTPLSFVDATTPIGVYHFLAGDPIPPARPPRKP